MRSNKGLIAALVVSLALNLALIGFAAGRIGAGPGAHPIVASFGAARVLRQLPDARQDELRPLYREQMREIRPHIRELRQSQHHLAAALTAEPFDRDVLAAELAEFRTALLASQTASHQALVELAHAMTPEERALLRTSIAFRARSARPPGDREGHGERSERTDRGPDAPASGGPHPGKQ